MERPNTGAGLLEKHREIAGQIDATRLTMIRLVADLEAIEHTIYLFDPDAALPRAKPLPSKDGAARGEMQRIVLAALRGVKEPLTSLDMARQVVAVRKLSEGPATLSMIRKRVGAALWKLRAKGWATEIAQVGSYKGWRMA